MHGDVRALPIRFHWLGPLLFAVVRLLPSLKTMPFPLGTCIRRPQLETNTKIAIRGRGSVKEGSSKDPKYDHGEDEEPHVMVTGDTQEEVRGIGRCMHGLRCKRAVHLWSQVQDGSALVVEWRLSLASWVESCTQERCARGLQNTCTWLSLS